MHFSQEAIEQAAWSVFKISKLKSEQLTVMKHILNQRDCCALFPTGFGKSICFQLPATLLGDTTLVISPLISLMQDQVQSLQKKGIRCCSITAESASLLTSKSPDYFSAMSLIYVSPERLLTKQFKNLLKQLSIRLIVLDEAHCISEWGREFRPAYRNIYKMVSHISPRPVIAAFTATASQHTLSDVIRYGGLTKPVIVATSSYSNSHTAHSVGCASEVDKFCIVLQLLRSLHSKKVLMYCQTRRETVMWKNMLLQTPLSKIHAIEAYHAGLSTQEKRQILIKFRTGVISVVCATSAFGMGIDIPDIRSVVHVGPPFSVAALQQEIGRAGRDRKPSFSLFLHTTQDWKKLTRMVAPSLVHEVKKLRDIALSGTCLSQLLGQEFIGSSNAKPCMRCLVCTKTNHPLQAILLPQQSQIGGVASLLTNNQVQILSTWMTTFPETLESGAHWQIPGISSKIQSSFQKWYNNHSVP